MRRKGVPNYEGDLKRMIFEEREELREEGSGKNEKEKGRMQVGKVSATLALSI